MPDLLPTHHDHRRDRSLHCCRRNQYRHLHRGVDLHRHSSARLKDALLVLVVHRQQQRV